MEPRIIVLSCAIIAMLTWLVITLPKLYNSYIVTGMWTGPTPSHIFDPSPDVFFIFCQTIAHGLWSAGLSTLYFASPLGFSVVIAFILFVAIFRWKAHRARKQQLFVNKLLE